MLAYFADYRECSGAKYQNPLCAKIFVKDEIESLFLYPDDPRAEALHIECQLWEKQSRDIVNRLTS